MDDSVSDLTSRASTFEFSSECHLSSELIRLRSDSRERPASSELLINYLDVNGAAL